MLTEAVTVAVAVIAAVGARPVHAFAPYRSTDADTPPRWTLETRLGLLAFERASGASSYTAPLLNLTFGLPFRLELSSDFAFRADQARVSELTAGAKWVPLYGRWNAGIEVVALLPPAAVGGAGIQALALLTVRWDPLMIHLNAGGFYQDQAPAAQSGWIGGALVEAVLAFVKPGLELAANHVRGAGIDLQLGLGAIVDVGLCDIRSAIHVGLTDAAPDVAASLWVSTAFSLD